MLFYLFLIFALSVDAFLASFSTASENIKIPILSKVTICTICSLSIIVFACFGYVLNDYIPLILTKIISFLILCGIGTIKIFDYYIKQKIKSNYNISKNLSFNFCHLIVILKIYADTTQADIDKSKHLTINEAITLSLALSIDGMATGFGIGLFKPNIFLLCILSFIITLFALYLGDICALFTKKILKKDISYISGIILILLGISKIL